jgi:hypothetical protein
MNTIQSFFGTKGGDIIAAIFVMALSYFCYAYFETRHDLKTINNDISLLKANQITIEKHLQVAMEESGVKDNIIKSFLCDIKQFQDITMIQKKNPINNHEPSVKIP